MGCHFLLQGIFPTQGSNPGLLHCRQILYRLSYKIGKTIEAWDVSWKNDLLDKLREENDRSGGTLTCHKGDAGGHRAPWPWVLQPQGQEGRACRRQEHLLESIYPSFRRWTLSEPLKDGATSGWGSGQALRHRVCLRVNSAGNKGQREKHARRRTGALVKLNFLKTPGLFSISFWKWALLTDHEARLCSLVADVNGLSAWGRTSEPPRRAWF